MKTLIALLMLGVATPAVAQHSGHPMPMPAKPAPKPKPGPAPVKKSAPKKKPAQPPVKKAAPPVKPAPAKATPARKAPAALAQPASEPIDHSKMDHGQMDQNPMPQDKTGSMDDSRMGQGGADAAEMDHSKMDQSQMDHGAMGQMDMAPTVETPPPPAAGSGPARAADAIWGADAMRASRKALRYENGRQRFAWFMADRLEYRARQGADGYLWDVQGYYGGDIDKAWFKSEGEGGFGEKAEAAEVQALWSHAIGPWFDLQAGVRQDIAGPDRTHAVIGVQGLAPYLFEVDAAAFLSHKGDVTARIEGEVDQRITQRLILQPRGEINLSAQDIPALGIGAGIDTIELGLRLCYEFTREFAPYIGIEQEWKVGGSADYARAAGEDPSVTNYVVGIRFWF